ncbi:MAG: discoidin domain-containing protein [Candidatus Eremiobacteraeota bacterium]|nr:discoidin domain-containing protein [Candidatus Eremiobacteraeota bacterium]
MRVFQTVVLLCAVIYESLASAAAVRRTGDVPLGTVEVRVDARPSHRIAMLQPLEALGSTVDKEPAGSIPRLYSRQNVAAMLDAGWGWLSYRLFTELSVQDWHWNPTGRFSEKDGGYWTSSASTRRSAIIDSFGYRLPHRGFTPDQGNNADYSRLTDGDPRTYWKSNPYLSAPYTRESDALHPQWAVIDLEHRQAVDAIRIAWVNPYATKYTVQYWSGGDDPMGDPAKGRWQAFSGGVLRQRAASTVSARLETRPIVVRFVRVLMTQSSNTCDSHGTKDRRNCVGYAIGELSLGRIDARGHFVDAVRHARCGGETAGLYRCGRRQTATYVSSVDPWHTARDRVRDQEQPGLDLIARSGLGRGLPMMVPVPMLYSTPENAVAEIRYMRAHQIRLFAVELGEEPDGQYTTPEDDAALYLQWARALHAFDPHLRLGGPVFSGVNADLQTWADAHGDVSWLHRFLRYLHAHRALHELSFMSFEHYPFDGCERGAALQHDLLVEPSIQKAVVDAWRADGLPSRIPMYVTEANFSATNFTQTPMLVAGGLWQADYMAGFLSLGVARVVYYQYEPVPLSQNRQCRSDWGNLTMFAANSRARIRARTAQFWAARMLTREWFDARGGAHGLYPVSVQFAGTPAVVTAYALRRPGGEWSLLLINKDVTAHTVRATFNDGVATRSFRGTVTRVVWGAKQYVWHTRGASSAPQPDDPPTHDMLQTNEPIVVPAQSLIVLRGNTTS